MYDWLFIYLSSHMFFFFFFFPQPPPSVQSAHLCKTFLHAATPSPLIRLFRHFVIDCYSFYLTLDGCEVDRSIALGEPSHDFSWLNPFRTEEESWVGLRFTLRPLTLEKPSCLNPPPPALPPSPVAPRQCWYLPRFRAVSEKQVHNLSTLGL
ncbi:hypothetical protein QL093DRAFT_1290609 [Fusarium oxysporum]|nr:hypothetical protein QL093DRAFT_1290609 [Fusarium oxysporum]